MNDSAIQELPIEQLLIMFLHRVEKNSTQDLSTDTATYDRVRDILKKPCQADVLQHALANYVKCGGKTESKVYGPLVKLCNQVLETIRKADIAADLDEVLRPEDHSNPIQFLRYDSLPLVYDWLEDGAPCPLTLRFDILIVRKNDIGYYEASQTQPNKPFDPSGQPTSTEGGPTIKIKHVLGCMEVKSGKGPTKAGDVESQTIQTSESSQVSVSSANVHEQQSASSQHYLPDSPQSYKTSFESHVSSSIHNAHSAHIASCASELLSRGLYVTHNISLKIKHRIIELTWYDRQSTISSKPFDMTTNCDLFVMLIVALSRLSLSDWGIVTELYPDDTGHVKSELPGGLTIHMDMKMEPLYHRVSLRGRGTMVLQGNLCNSSFKNTVMVKASYPEVWRTPEQFFISESQKTSLANHFPLIHYAGDFGPATSDIRHRLGLEKGLDRIRRIIIFEPLNDITSLTESEQVAKVWVECLDAHWMMWMAGYEHGDISVDNLMYRNWDGIESGQVTGVISGWDLATSRHVQQDAATEKGDWTGTVPFASLELVQNPTKQYTRRYRHDLESFGWCLVYVCLFHYDNLTFLEMWHDNTLSIGAKSAFLLFSNDYSPRPGFEDLYQSVRELMNWLMFDIVGSFKDRETIQELKDDEVWEGMLKFRREILHKNL